MVDPRLLSSNVECFLDFEASGLHPDSYPIEVGICYGRKSYSALIRPVSYWEYWSHDAQDIHGISREELQSKGKDVETVANDLNRLFAGKVIWADSNYDNMWMETLFEAAKVEQRFVVGNLFGFVPKDDAKPFMFLPETVVHRALKDARDIRAVWKKYVKTKGGSDEVKWLAG